MRFSSLFTSSIYIVLIGIYCSCLLIVVYSLYLMSDLSLSYEHLRGNLNSLSDPVEVQGARSRRCVQSVQEAEDASDRVQEAEDASNRRCSRSLFECKKSFLLGNSRARSVDYYFPIATVNETVRES